MGGGRPRAAPPGGGTGRCGGGRTAAAAGPARRPAPRAGTTESPEERAARRHYRLIAPGSRGRGVQRPAANGRAAMADTEGESVSRGWRGGRKALAAARASSPRPSETPEANHSPRPPPPLLLRSPPPPPRQLITKHPLCSDSAAARGLLGNGVRSSVPAAGLRPTRNYNSQDSALLRVLPCSLLFLSPVPLVFWSHHLCRLLASVLKKPVRGAVSLTRLWRGASGISAINPNTKWFLMSDRERGRRLPEKLVALEPNLLPPANAGYL